MPLPLPEGSRMNSCFTIGVAGHVDHGKTTLVKALTGIDTDRKAEEKARGLSIEAGVAELNLPGGKSVALIDVPGHTDFLKNTVRGLNGVDLAVLVIAADDGVMPQTREHLEILKFFKAAAGLVVLTKTDLVDTETLELAELEAGELLKGTFLENCPILPFMPARPELSADIVSAIDRALAAIPVKRSDAPFRLWIDQVRSITGHGTVVSGTVASGKLTCNDEIELLPAATRTRARSLECHGCATPHAVVGQRIGINLHRVPCSDVRRGMCLAAPGAMAPLYLLNADLHVLPGAKTGIRNRQKIKIYLGTCVTNATVIMLTAERLEPGEAGLVQIRLAKPAAVLAQDTFVISPLNINTVIAGGRVLEISREKCRAAKMQTVLPYLSALRRADANAYVEAQFKAARGRLITARDLCVKTGLPLPAFEGAIHSRVQKGELAYIKGRGAVKQSHLDSLQQQFKAAIAEAFAKDPFKKSVGLSEVAEHLDHRAEEALLRIVADRLCQEGQITAIGGGYRLTGMEPTPDARFESQVSYILDYVQRAGMTPISPNFFWKRHQSQFGQNKVARLFNYLHNRKKLVRLNDNRYLSLQAIDEIKRRVSQAVAEKGYITIGDCKALFGYGRSGGAHVLDYLNEMGFTCRREEKHFLNRESS